MVSLSGSHLKVTGKSCKTGRILIPGQYSVLQGKEITEKALRFFFFLHLTVLLIAKLCLFYFYEFGRKKSFKEIPVCKGHGVKQFLPNSPCNAFYSLQYFLTTCVK